MRLRDVLDQGHPDAAAADLRGLRAASSLESLEDPLAVFQGDSGALVRDPDLDVVIGAMR